MLYSVHNVLDNSILKPEHKGTFKEHLVVLIHFFFMDSLVVQHAESEKLPGFPETCPQFFVVIQWKCCSLFALFSRTAQSLEVKLEGETGQGP